MTDSPIYDQLIRERDGGLPGTFTMEELNIILTARRLCSVPERPALMPPTVNYLRTVAPPTPIIPLWKLREQRMGVEETQEMDTKSLATALR